MLSWLPLSLLLFWSVLPLTPIAVAESVFINPGGKLISGNVYGLHLMPYMNAVVPEIIQLQAKHRPAGKKIVILSEKGKFGCHMYVLTSTIQQFNLPFKATQNDHCSSNLYRKA